MGVMFVMFGVRCVDLGMASADLCVPAIPDLTDAPSTNFHAQLISFAPNGPRTLLLISQNLPRKAFPTMR